MFHSDATDSSSTTPYAAGAAKRALHAPRRHHRHRADPLLVPRNLVRALLSPPLLPSAVPRLRARRGRRRGGGDAPAARARSTSIKAMPAAIAIQSAGVHPTIAENCLM